jgi:polysaccharide export outer membrane protein
MNRRNALAALGIVLLGAGALLGQVRAAEQSDDNGPHAGPGTYLLRPMDMIKVQVFEEPDLDRELRVSQDRTIVMPLIGSISVRGRTVRDAEKLIRDLYARDYLVNPQINITIMEYSPRSVNVLGAVNSPGSVLLDAVAHSGGFSRLANRGKVSLTRTYADGHNENFTINADKLVTGDSSNTWTVQDGDVIFVPESVL